MDDEGAIQTLEAIIVSTLIVSAVAFVATFERPSLADEGARHVVTQRALDALHVLAETPLMGASGETMLSAYIALCLQGNCTRLESKLERLLPTGASFALYASNGLELYPVYEPSQPPGPSVSARVTIEPLWSSTFLAPAVSSVNPVGDPVVLYALPIFHSNALTSDGTPILVTMEGMRLSDGAKYVMQGSVSTRAAGPGESAQPAASLYFVDATGAPIAADDGRAQTLDASKSPSGANLPLRLRLAETAGVAIAAGTRVTVTLPPGWTGWAESLANAADWRIDANATNENGSAIVATLLHDVAASHADLLVGVTYGGDANDHYAIRAFASGSAGASASLLLRGDDKTGKATYEAPTLLLGAPRPLGVGAPTTWSVSAHVPAPIPGLPAESVQITKVTIRPDDAVPIFDSVAGLQTQGGAWVLDGANLTWTGSAIMTHDAPFWLTLNVTGQPGARVVSDRAPYTPAVLLDTTTATMPDETSPGLHRVPLAPTARGYNSSTGTSLSLTHGAVASQPYRATALPGETEYTVGYFSPLQDALFGSVVQVGERRVAAGGTQTVHVNAQPVMYSLAALGYSPSVSLYVYPPWTLGERHPSKTIELSPTTLLDAENLDPTTGIYDVEIPVESRSFFGAYVVEARVAWSEEVTQTLEGTPVTEIFSRSASMFDYYVVTPPSLLVPPTPLYDVHLVVWMQDWR